MLAKELKRAIECVFRGVVAPRVPELCTDLWKKMLKSAKFDLFGDLWWPDTWPDLKNDRSNFFIIFYALSNAAYRVSQNCPGAELQGRVQTPLPSLSGPSRVTINMEVSRHVAGSDWWICDLSGSRRKLPSRTYDPVESHVENISQLYDLV